MHKNSHPLEFVIEFALANGCNRFIINNAKDELKMLKKEVQILKHKLSSYEK